MDEEFAEVLKLQKNKIKEFEKDASKLQRMEESFTLLPLNNN
jgi:hypothetical protein